MIRPVSFVLLVALALSGCGGTIATAPSTGGAPAPASIHESYKGTLGVGAFGFYSFTTTAYGIVEVTLNSLDGVDGPAVVLGLAVGVPRQRDCTTSNTVTAAPGTTPQLTATLPPGIYCARIYDTGNLTGPTTFDVTIGYP